MQGGRRRTEISPQERSDSTAGAAGAAAGAPHGLLLGLQRSAGNAAVARLIAREPATAAPPAAPNTTLAQQRSDALYDALNWVDDEAAALRALRGLDAATRAEMQRIFLHDHDETARSYIQSNLGGDDLVRALGLLTAESEHGAHVELGLALIPSGTRDDELMRILESRSLAARQEVERRYDETYAGVMTGTLKGDIKDDTSGWRRQKCLALLDRELTKADHIYFNSVAISGTHTASVVADIQAVWAEGPAAFQQLKRDWDTNVVGHRGDDEEWTSMNLYDAMYDELSGEEWLLVKACFDGLARYEGRMEEVGGQSRDAWLLSPEEDARLVAAEASLEAAANQGLGGGVGTNEEQVYGAISTIRQIWTARMERARNPDNHTPPDELARLEAEWSAKRASLLAEANDELSGGELLTARLKLSGDLSTADEVYIAWQDGNSDKVIELVTKAWQEGKTAELQQGAATEKRDGDELLRPTYQLDRTVPITSGTPWVRMYLMAGEDHPPAVRGKRRLKLELDEGSSDTQLEAAVKLLKDAPAALRTATVTAFVEEHLSDAEGSTPTEKFLGYVNARYERSHQCFEMADLIDPTSDPARMLERAEGRRDAANSGVLNFILNDFVRDYEDLTAEDTSQVVEESLERLRFIATQAGAHPHELEAMAAMNGVPVTGLAQFEYEQFRARLEALRELKAKIAEGIAKAVEIAVDVALTVATGGAAGAALMVSLASAVAGMATRELLLGTNYELFSRANFQQLAATVASSALSAAGGSIYKDAIGLAGEEAFEELATRGQRFWAAAIEEAGDGLGEAMVGQMFSNKLPTAEEMATGALSLIASSAGAGLGDAAGHLTPDREATMSAMQQFRHGLVASVAGDLVGTTGEQVGRLASGELTRGDQTGAAWLGEMSLAVLGSIGQNTVDSIRDDLAEGGGEADAPADEATPTPVAAAGAPPGEPPH